MEILDSLVRSHGKWEAIRSVEFHLENTLFQLDRLHVHLPIAPDQRIEAPVEVLAAHFLEHRLHVLGVGVLVVPAIVVGVHAGIEAFVAEVGEELVQREGRLHVHVRAVVLGCEAGGMKAGRLVHVLARVQAVGEFGHFAMTDGPSAERCLGNTVGDHGDLPGIALVHVAQFAKTVHALVHPGVIALVAAQDPIEPVVSHFVRDHLVQRLRLAALTNDRDHRVLHAAAGRDRAIHRGACAVGVFTHPLGIVQHGLSDVVGTLGPFRRVLRRVHGPCGHGAAALRKGHFALADDEALVGDPGEVVDLVLCVADGLHRGG